ncbi:MAG TPA: hypothetical protein VGM56_07540 [Byssovorax sp.]|jgi:hypothetical protein
MTAAAALFIGGLALAACGGDKGGGKAAPGSSGAAAAPAGKSGGGAATPGIKAGETIAASCDTIAKDSECGEVVITAPSQKAESMAAMKQLCKAPPGEAACPSAKMVGTCRVMKDIINHYYADGPKSYAVDAAKKACEGQHGHWVN